MAGFSAPLAFFLALVLGASAIHKLIAADRLAAATGRLTRVAPPLDRVLMLGAAAVEASSAVALVIPATRPAGALAAAALWGCYAVLLQAAASRGEAGLDCGCGFGRHRGGEAFPRLRALVLAGLAVLAAVLPVPGAIAGEPFLAAIALFALYLAAGELAALPKPSRSLM